MYFEAHFVQRHGTFQSTNAERSPLGRCGFGSGADGSEKQFTVRVADSRYRHRQSPSAGAVTGRVNGLPRARKTVETVLGLGDRQSPR